MTSAGRRDDSADYARILGSGLPLIDTRAPVEFAKGSFPGAVNLPVMTDSERQKVGTCYKQQGQEAAIRLGHQLVSGAVKAARVQAWHDFAHAHPEGYLFCFRGGLRSQISQQWLAEAGMPYPRIRGGYKAMRGFLLQTLDAAVADLGFLRIGGLTGSGKTEVLQQLANGVDLEGHANHRGSSFGRRATSQPSQIGFENALAIDLLRKREAGWRTLVLEDEARLIGRCALPLPLHQRMPAIPLVWLEATFEARVERILRDYVIDLCAEFVSELGAEQGPSGFHERLQEALRHIAKRLRPERARELADVLAAAFVAQQRGEGFDGHRDWIRVLLREYYDPLYAHHRQQRDAAVVFRGDRDEVLHWLRHHHANRHPE